MVPLVDNIFLCARNMAKDTIYVSEKSQFMRSMKSFSKVSIGEFHSNFDELLYNVVNEAIS